MPSIGLWSLILAFLVATYSAVSALLATRSLHRRNAWTVSARTGIYVVAGLATLASLLLLVLLLTRSFQVAYVHDYTSTNLAWVYKLSAFWAGQEGSLLLWFWFVSIMALLAVRRDTRFGAHLVVPLAAVEAFFALLLIVISNPFRMLPVRPAEGLGMLPLLENPGMVIHPPVLFLGYAAYTIPFALTIAALSSGQVQSGWVRIVRRWNLLAWLALGAGILIGAWWSYFELGWGGYWVWDPVENASLVPWLAGTAYLHSVLIEERRGLHRMWNAVMPVLTLALCLFATLITRGGLVVSGLHGFSSTLQPIAFLLLGFIALVLVWGSALAYKQRATLSERETDRLVSREGAFLITNLLFCGAAAVVLLGTVYPAIARTVRGAVVSLQPAFYNRAVGPLLVLVLAVMGVCPVMGWQGLSVRGLRVMGIALIGSVALGVSALLAGVRQPFAVIVGAISTFVALSLVVTVARDLIVARRNGAGAMSIWLRARRRYGAHIVHLAIVLVASGIAGSTAFKQQEMTSLLPGQSAKVLGLDVRYEGFDVQERKAQPESNQSHVHYAARLQVSRGGKPGITLTPSKNYHWTLTTPWVTEVAVQGSWREDLYVVLANLEDNGRASFQIQLNPLVNWIWAGGVLLLVGSVLAMWPMGERAGRED